MRYAITVNDFLIYGSLLGSSFLAIDMGGYQLAVDLAADQAVGKYGGILVSAILGCTVSFTVPMSAGMVEKKACWVSFFSESVEQELRFHIQ